MRENMPKPKDYTITRDIIKIKSIRSKIYEDHIGYIRVASFQERTADDLKKEIHDLNIKVQDLEKKIDELHAENKLLKSKL